MSTDIRYAIRTEIYPYYTIFNQLLHSAGQWSFNFASQLTIRIALVSGHLILPVS